MLGWLRSAILVKVGLERWWCVRHDVYLWRLTKRESLATGSFEGGSGCRIVAQTRQAFLKMPQAPSVFPQKRATQKINLALRGGLEPGGQPHWVSRMPVLARVTWMPASRNPCQEASADCYRSQDTPDLIRVPRNTAGRSVSQPSDALTELVICRTSYRPDECGTRPF